MVRAVDESESEPVAVHADVHPQRHLPLVSITPNAPLPQIQDDIAIDGFTQPNGEGDPIVELSGAQRG